MIKPIRCIMAATDDVLAQAVCIELHDETTDNKPRIFGDWVSGGGYRIATGSICSKPIDLLLVPTRAIGLAVLKERGFSIDECVFVLSGEPLWYPKRPKSWDSRNFTMNAERIRKNEDGAESSGFQWLVGVHATAYIHCVANQIAADYVYHFVTRLALGMAPWGCTKGMREIPKTGEPKQILSAFGRPQDALLTLPPTPFALQGFFCPNALNDRSALVEDLVPEKVDAFVGVMEKILRLIGDQVRDVEFFALAPDLLDYPAIVPVLHPRTLANGMPEEHLRRNWSAFTAVVQKLETATKRHITLTSIASRVGPLLACAEEEARQLTVIDAIVEDFAKSVPSYTVLNVAETRRRVVANLTLYLASARVAKEEGAVLIGVEVSGKYWDRLWGYLQEQDIAPPLFWLPKYARQHFAFKE